MKTLDLFGFLMCCIMALATARFIVILLELIIDFNQLGEEKSLCIFWLTVIFWIFITLGIFKYL